MPGRRARARSGAAASPEGRARPAAERSTTITLDDLVSTKEVVIACGPGGVGKTTVAAATAMMAALRLNARVLVLTIDPARRLANALGLTGIGNDEHKVPEDSWLTAGLRPKGELWAAMLDTKQSWDELVRRHAPDLQTATTILANPLYKGITARFVQSHEYIAMERLYDIHASAAYDLVVVDTPPTRNALDFLDAPSRMADFFASRLLRWLIAPYRSRLVSVASRPFYQIADRILGSQFIQDITEFFVSFQSMYDGFSARAEAVARLLADARTGFVVVSTLEPVPAREAEFFARALVERRLDLTLLVLNKVLPAELSDRGATAVAERLRDDAVLIAADLAVPGLDPVACARVLEEVGTSFLNFQKIGLQESALGREMSAAAGSVVRVPFFQQDIADLGGLAELGGKLWPG